MTASSLLNLSHGKRKEAEKKGQGPSEATKMQQRAEPKNFKRTPSSADRFHASPQSRGRTRFGDSPASGGRQKESTPTFGSRQNAGARSLYSPASSGHSGQASNRDTRHKNDYDDDESPKAPDHWLKGYGARNPGSERSMTESREVVNVKSEERKTV